MEAAAKQVEKQCIYPYIIDGKKIKDPDNRVPMDKQPTDMQRLCIFMNLLGECSSAENDTIATAIICVAENAIHDIRRTLIYRPSLSELQAAITNRIQLKEKFAKDDRHGG